MARPDLVRRVIRNVRRDGLKPTIDKVFAKLDTPIPLGYSLAGEVIEVGRGVNGWAVGDRVACAGAGLANHADFNAVPKNLAVAIPAGVDDEDASFVTLGAIALQGVRLAAPTLGEKIVVMGLGLIGLLTVQLLKANGCRVLGFDPTRGAPTSPGNSVPMWPSAMGSPRRWPGSPVELAPTASSSRHRRNPTSPLTQPPRSAV